MIELKNISFSYGKKSAINKLSTEFKRGILYGIIGPNGCGKTTLLRLICGLLKETQGEILIDGSPLSNYSQKELAKNISLMPQTRPVPDMTVYDFVSSGRFPYLGLSRKLREIDFEKIEKAMAATQTAEFANRYLTSLSGGERQRVYLALLLAQDTDYILLDEPSSFLDISHSILFNEILVSLKKNGKCIVSVFHDISSALKCCDKILVMQNGELKFSGNSTETVKSEILKTVFGVKCIPLTHGNDIFYNFIKQ